MPIQPSVHNFYCVPETVKMFEAYLQEPSVPM